MPSTIHCCTLKLGLGVYLTVKSQYVPVSQNGGCEQELGHGTNVQENWVWGQSM